MLGISNREQRTNKKTFKTFYNKPIVDNSVGILKGKQLFLEGLKHLVLYPQKFNGIKLLNFVKARRTWCKIEGRCNTSTYFTHSFITLTISTTFRSPSERFIKWLLDVEVEKIESSTEDERKNGFIVLTDFVQILLFT